MDQTFLPPSLSIPVSAIPVNEAALSGLECPASRDRVRSAHVTEPEFKELREFIQGSQTATCTIRERRTGSSEVVVLTSRCDDLIEVTWREDDSYPCTLQVKSPGSKNAAQGSSEILADYDPKLRKLLLILLNKDPGFCRAVVRTGISDPDKLGSRPG